MKTFLLISSFSFVMFSFAQNNLNMRFPTCELRSNDIKGIKTFEITTQEEFEKYFKMKGDTLIDFRNTMVLAGIVGSDKPDKFIKIDAASYLSVKGKALFVRYELSDKANNLFKKYAVAVIQKPDYKKVFFMKGKSFELAVSGE